MPTGSPEHQAAVAFNGGVQRRNSIDEAHSIHALQPRGLAPSISQAQLHGLRNGGRIDAQALMDMIPHGSERAWDPNLGGGRNQIRTGRNFTVPQTGSANPFEIRVHTRDNQIAGLFPLSNAATGSVIRISEKKKSMLSETVVSSNKMINGANWIGSTSKDPVLINSAHIPATLQPGPPPPPVVAPRTWPTLGSVASMAGSALWHGSGASTLVDGTQQFAQNMKPGGTWTGVGKGAAKMVAAGLWMGTLANTAPARAVAGTAVAGVSALSGMLSGRH